MKTYKQIEAIDAICEQQYQDEVVEKTYKQIEAIDAICEQQYQDEVVEKYEGKTLNNPTRSPAGSASKFHVYVKNKKGNVVKVNFGDPNSEIKRDDPATT